MDVIADRFEVTVAAAVHDQRLVTAAEPDPFTLILLTEPSGLELDFDGQRVPTPWSVQSLVGSTHTLSARRSQRADKVNYTFESWSDGGAQAHTITTPDENASYTATYQTKGKKNK